MTDATSNEVTLSSKGRKSADSWVKTIELSDVNVIEGFNPRSTEHEKEITVLADSIAKNGLIHPPTVRPTETAGVFELIAGHRRYRALVTLGRTDALFIVRSDLIEDVEASAFAVAENSEDGRTSLTYVELGRTFQKMQEETSWGVQKIATKSGVHVATVRRALKLMEAPSEILDLVDAGTLSESAALTFASLGSDVQNILLSEEYSESITNASAYFIKELAKKAQKQIDAANKEEGSEGEEGEGEENSTSGKEKGKVKINWRTPTERTQLIRELAHEHKAKDVDTYKTLEILYWMRGHGEQCGDLSKKDMAKFIKDDKAAYAKAAAYTEEKEKKSKIKAKLDETIAKNKAKAAKEKAKNKSKSRK